MGVSLSRASLVCSWGASYSGVEGLLVRGSVFLLRRPEGESVEGRERRRGTVYGSLPKSDPPPARPLSPFRIYQRPVS